MPDPELEKVFNAHGFTDFRWIDPQKIVFGQWVRMKCIYGCSYYGYLATCPPNTPSVSDCERFVKEYSKCAVFHFEKKMDDPDERHEWTKEVNQKLYEVELELFKSGYVKAFLLPMDGCELCSECASDKGKCRHPEQARPTPDALGIDVYSTVRSIGYPIHVLSDYDQPMNRYAFLLIE
jgi:predicted metal-binding protein